MPNMTSKSYQQGNQEPWLEQLLNKSRSSKWCVKSYCTTCGCEKFCGHFLVLLSREIGFQLPKQERLRDQLDSISSENIALRFKEIVKALEELPKSDLDDHNNQALEVVLIDLYAMRLSSLSSSEPYGDIIKGTWVEKKFFEMEEANKIRREARREYETFNSPGNIEERS